MRNCYPGDGRCKSGTSPPPGIQTDTLLVLGAGLRPVLQRNAQVKVTAGRDALQQWRNAALTKHGLPDAGRPVTLPHMRRANMDWHQHLGFLLVDVAYRYARRFEEHARGLSLTLPQCKALAVLANCEGINQRHLSETSDIASTSLVRILDRLEAGGWVERSQDPHDRRAHLLTTTESAKPVVQHIWRAVSKANAEALKDLAIRDLPVLTTLLARVHENLVALELLQPEVERPNDADAAAPRTHDVSSP